MITRRMRLAFWLEEWRWRLRGAWRCLRGDYL